MAGNMMTPYGRVIANTMNDELQSKELLTLEEFKILGHERLRQLIKAAAVC